MRWPAGWSDVSVLKDSPVDYLLVDDADTARRLTADATARNLSITAAIHPPSGVELVKGDWPGTKLGPGDSDRVAAGPTGQPWIDSNGWRVLLSLARHAGAETWVEAAPKEPRLYPENYLATVADAAAHGGRWVIQLDERLAAGIVAGNAASLGAWKRIGASTRFFADWRWSDMQPLAWIGVVSDFAGDNEFLSHEVLNLLARANQPYRVVPLDKLSAPAIAGLKAVIYVDQAAPSATVRRTLSGFAERGGLLVAGNSWGGAAVVVARPDDHPRYRVSRSGKGRIAIARQPENDPYLIVQDAVVLLSHRHDLVRFWNAGAARACLSASPDRRRALLQVVFYANARGGDATVRLAGGFRTAQLFTPDSPAPKDLPVVREKDAVEVHLPPIGQYGAVLLSS